MLTSIVMFALLLHTNPAPAATPGIGDLKVTDTAGKARELRGLAKDARYLVVISHGFGCPTLKRSLPALEVLAQKFSKNTRFVLINANPQDSLAQLRQFSREFRSGIAVYKDGKQTLLQRLEVSSTTTAVVLDTQTWEIKYFGAISDQVNYDKTADHAKESYLGDALASLSKGDPVNVPRTRAYGCAITYQEVQ